MGSPHACPAAALSGSRNPLVVWLERDSPPYAPRTFFGKKKFWVLTEGGKQISLAAPVNWSAGSALIMCGGVSRSEQLSAIHDAPL